jgi:hypothetical protein
MKLKFTSLLVIVLILPTFLKAQCSCANGSIPDTISYSTSISSLSGPSTYIYFPKIDPGTGTLVCVTMSGTVNTVQNFRLTNREPFEVSDYMLDFARTTKIIGPGINKVAGWAQTYGPFSLTANPSVFADSSISIGPDTPFNNTNLAATTSNVVPYQGTSGNVQFLYTNTGSATLIQGSNNYLMYISTVVNAKFTLKYLVCPNVQLPNLFGNFQISKDSKSIFIKWSTLNEDIKSKYTVQVSKNGIDYENYDQFAAVGNQNTEYSSVYQKLSNYKGKLYFRVVALNLDGNVLSFSPVKIIQSEDFPENNFQIYPNPIQKYFNLVFNSPISGELKIDLFSLNGVLLESNLYRSYKQFNIQVQLKRQYAGGQYIVRLTNLLNQETITKNIIIQ